MTIIPAPPMLARPRLLRRVRSGLRAGHVLIAAPPGYGKSVLLRALAHELPGAQRLLLRPEDADPLGLRARLEPLLNSTGPLLLDDCHILADAPEARAIIASLLRERKPRLVLAGRVLPPEADRAGLLLNATDLAFTEAEAQALGLRSSVALERAAGWPLALGLLAQRGGDLPLDSTDDSDERLISTLVADMLVVLSPDLRRFLSVTAAPLRFSRTLATHLLGRSADALLAEALRHTLFIEPSGDDGWYQYHQLVRPALRAAAADAAELQARAVDQCVADADLPTAIDLALDAGMLPQAAALLDLIAPRFIATTGRYRTFQRWVLALDAQTQAAHPLLLVRLGRGLAELALHDEAWPYLNAGLRLAEARDPLTFAQARLHVASVHAIVEGNCEAALALCRPLLDDQGLPAALRRAALKTTANALYHRCDYAGAARLLRAALALPETADGPSDFALRQNLITTALLPLGAYAEAARLMPMNAAAAATSLVYAIWQQLTWAWLHEAMGDWDALERDIIVGLTLEAQTERPDDDPGGWPRLQALLLIGRGQTAAGEQQLAASSASADHESQIYLQIYRAWLARRRGDPATAVHLADAFLSQHLPQHQNLTHASATLILEREIAAFESGMASGPPAAQLQILMRLRARPQLLRFRALLALRCHAAGNERWRQHLTATLRMSTRFGYTCILTQRDPDLGGRLYALALVAGIPGATEALQQIGDIRPLLPFLLDPSAAPAAAAALVAIGAETAIPAIAEACAQLRDPLAQRALTQALEALEHAAPPPLTIRLLGGFGVVRNNTPIPERAWERPIVQRLFQYFAFHRGQPRSRDRILDDLWPDTDPKRAADTFRTVYSKLQNAIDPYLRPRSPARYFHVSGTVYTFDPDGYTTVDAERFEALIGDALRAAEQADIAPLDDALLVALEGYGDLLPEQPYAEWLLEPRERLAERYATGCRLAAEALLARGRAGEALPWTERALAVAPWMEEAHQAHIRALARTGQRSLALRAIARAGEALQRELNIAPGPLTTWLAERLQQNEEI